MPSSISQKWQELNKELLIEDISIYYSWFKNWIKENPQIIIKNNQEIKI